MIYRVCEHYYDNQSIRERQHNSECFICFETKTETGSLIIALKNQKIFIKNCICDGPIHNECLELWFLNSKKCPICRVNVIQNTNASTFMLNYVPFGINIYIFIKALSQKIIRILTLFLFIYATIDLYILIMSSRYRKQNGYIFNPEVYIVNHDSYVINQEDYFYISHH